MKLSEGRNKSAEHPMFDAALRESIKCRLLIADNDDIAINFELPEASRHPQTGDKLLPDTLVQLLFASDNEDEEDLGRLIAWYLAQDIYDAPGTWEEVEQRVAEQGVAESLDLKISSNSLFGQVADWMCYLGFAWGHALDSNKKLVVAEPTAYLRRNLKDLFQGQAKAKLSIREFIDRLAKKCPLFETGKFREQVEEKIGFRLPNHLSTSTAFALFRLQDDGCIKLVKESDADLFIFTGVGNEEGFSHIIWTGSRTMTFTKFVCWDVDRVRRVMGVEATQTPHSIFLATHHPIAMYRQELIDAPSRVTYSEEQFLKDFLAEQDFAFVPVLGSSGTGKSHLIRWLAANIESTQKRRVLLIPKIGTNLKDIISLILEGMPGASFDEYRQRLNRATSSLTEAQAREQLLNQLAAAVGPNGRGDRTKLSDVEDYLVGAVDSLLYDPFFRKHWLKDGGIIHQLVIHILGQRDTVEIVEERRHFSLGDLPLNVLNLGKAGKQAQDFYSFLIGDEDTQKATVDWLNRHLDEAIAQVLSLGREDLQRLMREVRETLAEQGIELVLLIEDFAKLQGIDREVLEAVLARPQQPGPKPLCAIRTALACTTGYFDSLRLDTVKQRITFSVNLDMVQLANNL
jgi:energy-coupling factor transporter ATP-binding protein EcfA2